MKILVELQNRGIAQEILKNTCKINVENNRHTLIQMLECHSQKSQQA